MADEPEKETSDECLKETSVETPKETSEESPKETSEDQYTPYTGNVYAATPSSGSGGGDEDNGDDDGNQDQVDAHQTQQMESIYNYLQETPTEDSTQKVSDWVNNTSSSEDTGNALKGEGVQQQCEKMEEDEAGTADDETGNGENSQSMGDGTDDINKDKTPGENSEATFKIFVSNLPPGFLDSELKELFEKSGEVGECEIFAKSYAFVVRTRVYTICTITHRRSSRNSCNFPLAF